MRTPTSFPCFLEPSFCLHRKGAELCAQCTVQVPIRALSDACPLHCAHSPAASIQMHRRLQTLCCRLPLENDKQRALAGADRSSPVIKRPKTVSNGHVSHLVDVVLWFPWLCSSLEVPCLMHCVHNVRNVMWRNDGSLGTMNIVKW